MIIKVFYHSSTGNTKKVADVIADTLNVSAEKITKKPQKFVEPVDLLFVGDGIYFGKANKNTIAFIEQLNSELVKNVAVFATYGGQNKIGSDLQYLLKNQGLQVIEDSFVCKGQSWGFMNRNHPYESELNKAREYAKLVMSLIMR